MSQYRLQTVRRSRWMAWSVPVLACLGWTGESQASDVIVSFEVAATPEAVSHELSPDVDRHILRFVPPQAVFPKLAHTYTPPLPSTEVKVEEPKATSASSQSTPPRPLLSVPIATIPTGSESTSLPLPPLVPEVAALFEGDDDSLVAIAIGHAEGTRTVDGQKTLAYYGHVDPGNQLWNLGTFSYQHGADSPHEADQKQLNRLKQQTRELYRLAFQKRLALTREEILNGIDLANQAPAAALDRGYVDWLADAKTMGLTAEEAILWARTRAFLDPDTARWNAPGLGNSVQSISQDQARRQRAIDDVLRNQDHSPSSIPEQPNSALPVQLKKGANEESSIDSVLFTDIVL